MQTTTPLLARIATRTAANAAAAADAPPPVLMTETEMREALERGVPAKDVLEDMTERGELPTLALARLDAVRGVGQVPVVSTTKPRVDIDDLFADLPDAAVRARQISIELLCNPSIAALAMLDMAIAATMGQVDLVLPPAPLKDDADEEDEILYNARKKRPFRAPLTAYMLGIGETADRKSELYPEAGDRVLVDFDTELKRAWAPKPGEAKVDPPYTRHSRATPAGLEIALLENGAAVVVTDEGEDTFRAFDSGDGRDQCGVLLTARVGKHMARTIAGDRTSKKPVVVRTNNPRANILAIVQDVYMTPSSEEDRKRIDRLYKRGLWSRFDIAEWETLTDADYIEVESHLKAAIRVDRCIADTAPSRWETRLRGLLPQVRPNGDQHPLALTLGSMSATLEPAAAAAIHTIMRTHYKDRSELRDFLKRAHVNVGHKAAALALLRQGHLDHVVVTLADVQRAERLVFGYLLPNYAKIRTQAAATATETDEDHVFEKVCRLAERGGGSTTEALVLDGLGRKGWGVTDPRDKLTRLDKALIALSKGPKPRIERRKVGKANRLFPIGGTP